MLDTDFAAGLDALRGSGLTDPQADDLRRTANEISANIQTGMS